MLITSSLSLTNPKRIYKNRNKGPVGGKTKPKPAYLFRFSYTINRLVGLI